MDLSSYREQVPIMFSHERLQMLIETSNLPIEDVFQNYVKNLHHMPILDFPMGNSWFNTNNHLSFKNHLKGKLVLLDFFTYCCINCMHILPDLKEIEQSFSIEDGLVVIGVHSAKFENEKDDTNVANAVQRYNIEHAVFNDVGARMWQQCDVHCWPTLLLVSPEGIPLVMLMGEGHREALKLYIKHFLVCFKLKLSNHSLPIGSSFHQMEVAQEPLQYPGKICIFEKVSCDAEHKRLLAFTDSGNNRIIVYDRSDELSTVIGCPLGKAGYADGFLEEARFKNPQGVVFLNEHILFVADTENHAIRRIDLQRGVVTTIAGNGSQCSDRIGGRVGTKQGISSPWDVEIFASDQQSPVLLVAMAGTHQIWAVFLEKTTWWKGKQFEAGAVVCIAGSGREENRNNSYPQNAAFAQPSGLALCADTSMLYVADSESSSVRVLSLIDGCVSSVVGGDRNPTNLFAFGDVDGVSYDAKLQHCLGVAIARSANGKGRVFVADTYNHKLKVVDTRLKRVQTIAAPALSEPCGLCQSRDGTLFVADTNNHKIKAFTMNDDFTEVISAETLNFDGVQLQLSALTDAVDRKTNDGENVFVLDAMRIRGRTTFVFNLKLMEGLHWTPDAPQKWTASFKRKALQVQPGTGPAGETFAIVVDDAHDDDVLVVALSAFTCLKNVCLNQRFVIELPIEGGGDLEQNVNEMRNINVIIATDEILVSDALD